MAAGRPNIPRTAQQPVIDRFLRALTERDFVGLARCFSPDVRFRALVSRGLREATGADDSARYFQGWFGPADRIDVLETRSADWRPPASGRATSSRSPSTLTTDSSGRPASLVAQSSTGTLVANSWNTLPVSATLQANTSHWLVYNANGTSYALDNMY